MGQENEGINVLGQKFDYPKAIHGTVAVCVGWISIALIICFSVHNFVHASKEQINAIRELLTWTPIEVSADGKLTQQDTKRIEFWTPSSKTKIDPETKKNVSHDKPPNDQWEVNKVDEARVFAFGKKLEQDLNVKGYRRNEVLGVGRSTSLKAGWWWVMSVNKNYKIAEFVKVYRDFWGSPDPIYIEVIGVTTSTGTQAGTKEPLGNDSTGRDESQSRAIQSVRRE